MRTIRTIKKRRKEIAAAIVITPTVTITIIIETIKIITAIMIKM